MANSIVSGTWIPGNGFVLPDPLLPSIPAQSPAYCLNQRRRKAAILAETRTLFATKGYDGFSIRTVAQHSDVSVQTIYNLVGDRRRLISDAVIEYIKLMAEAAFASDDSPNSALGLTSAYVQSSIAYPAYIRNATLTYFPPDRPLFQEISATGCRFMSAAFEHMRVAGHWSQPPDDTLNQRITAIQTMMILDFFSGSCTADDFEREMARGTAALLMNVVTSTHRAKMEEWLSELG